MQTRNATLWRSIAAALVLSCNGAWGEAAVSLFDDGTHGFSAGMTIGWEFIPRQDLLVDQLGYYDADRNGLAIPHEVGLFRVSDRALLVSGTVQPSDPLQGYFRYTRVTQTRLYRGQRYFVGGLNPEFVSGRPWDQVGIPDVNSIRFAQNINFRGWAWGSSAFLSFPAEYNLTTRPWAASTGYMFVASFQTAAAAPPPQSRPPSPPTVSPPPRDVLAGKNPDQLYQEVQNLYGRFASTRPGQADCDRLLDTVRQMRAYEPSRARVPERWAYTVQFINDASNPPTIGDLSRDRQARMKSGQAHCFSREAALYEEVQQIYLSAERSCAAARRAVDQLQRYQGDRHAVPQNKRYSVRFPSQLSNPMIGDLAYDRILRIRQTERGCFP